MNRRNVPNNASMKYAPIKVIRTEKDVKITAFINFTGDADSCFPYSVNSDIVPSDSTNLGSGETYAEVAAKSIMNIWKGNFEIDGQSLKVDTFVYSNNSSPNNVLTPVFTNRKQKFLKIHIGAGPKGHLSSLPGAFSMRSHGGINIIGAILNNESILKWSIEKSSSWIVIYDHVRCSKTGKMQFTSRNWFEQTTAHEFGHALGLGDAYNAGYRGGSWAGSVDGYYAPYSYQIEDEYCNWNYVYIPDNDIMLEGETHNYASSNDIRMVLNAYKTGKPEFFPWGSKSYKDRYKVTKDIRS